MPLVEAGPFRLLISCGFGFRGFGYSSWYILGPGTRLRSGSGEKGRKRGQIGKKYWRLFLPSAEPDHRLKVLLSFLLHASCLTDVISLT